jgi:5-methylcytosine-specific restriction endonuclease McrA
MRGEEDQQLRALVLSTTMQPDKIMSWEKAVTLVVLQKVDVLETYDVECRSPSISIQFPAVIRLRKHVRKHKDGVKFSRSNVLTRDGSRCCYCGLRMHPKHLTYDHVLPRSRGGKTTWLNIVSACKPCNRRKGNKTPAEMRWSMHFKPYRPTTLPDAPPMLIDLSSAPAIWLPYIAAVAQTA